MVVGTNVFFNNFTQSQEQTLFENLIIESIKIYGQEMIYIPRNIVSRDGIYTEDDQSSYTVPMSIEMYIKSIDGFSGDGEFMSRFGLEIRDQVVFSVSQRIFKNGIGDIINISRPREGDIVYFPLNNKVFQIKFVNKYEIFYQVGNLTTWELTCELFEYSDEIFNTGIPEIDRIQKIHSTNIFDWALTDEDGNVLMTEESDYLIGEKYEPQTVDPASMNEELEVAGDAVIDFSESNPFAEDM
jgi:hypothetical protein